ncbi:hypothetical protein NLJ89_g3831 [Agrocybe chaxingu]|uniref:Uncharacterized protein n=1 Tax=Agrocybe chaxingu TaxID=84603 RepID=A0A9W8K1Q8_9AGAR|nr:hypothetical protein NLJ89_g3831 [Agrocybe chaxingu]
MGEAVWESKSPLQSLAQELLDTIIDEIALPITNPFCIIQHSTAEGVDTLRHCALVCRAFRHQSQRHLFKFIDITSLLFGPTGSYSDDRLYRQRPEAWKRLNEVLKENPLLATYVRELGLWVDPEDLPWITGDLEEVFSDIMESVVKAGKLRRILLSSHELNSRPENKYPRLPAGIITRLWDPYISQFQMQALGGGGILPIRSLSFHRSYSAIEELLAHPSAPIGSLRSLELDTDSRFLLPHQAFSVIARLKHSLEYLRLKTSKKHSWSLVFWLRVDSRNLDWPRHLPALKVLDIDVVCNPPTRRRPECSMKGISSLLEAAGNRLEKLRLTLYVGHFELMCPRMLVDSLNWELLEAALHRSLQTSSDRRFWVYITIGYYWNTVEREGIGIPGEEEEEYSDDDWPEDLSDQDEEEEQYLWAELESLQSWDSESFRSHDPSRVQDIKEQGPPPINDKQRSDEELLKEGAKFRDGYRRLCGLVLKQIVDEKFTRFGTVFTSASTTI